MARKNPTYTTTTPRALPSDVQLPYTIGVSQDALQDGNAMPEVNMTPNDGDNPSFESPAFATGKDNRVFDGGPSGNDPMPAMPGAK